MSALPANLPTKLSEAYPTVVEYVNQRSRTFRVAARFLPKEKRQIACVTYAFFRRIDDMVDEDQISLADFRAWRTQSLEPADQQIDPVLAAWADLRERHEIDPQLVENMLDGIEMDISKQRYATFDDLLQYCYKVATSGAFLALPLVRMKEQYSIEDAKPKVEQLALGVELTDLLCDIGEDAAKGRIYLPDETLKSFSLTYQDIENRVFDERFQQMMRHLVAIARQHFMVGWPVLNYFPLGERLAAGFLSKFHWEALNRIEQVGYDVYSHQIKFSTIGKFRLLVSYLPACLTMKQTPN